MKNYFTQTDPKWKNVEFPYYKKTIGEIGCLVTSIANIVLDTNLSITPEVVLSLLVGDMGITNGNLVLWNSVYNLFKLRHAKYSKNTFDKIDREKFKNAYYVVEIDCTTYSHFCNILEFKNDKVEYFDVYDGKIKSVNKERIISIRVFELVN